jgi:hypothetical protein
VLSRLTRTGLRRGLLGGSRTWLVVGATAGGVRVLRRLARKEPRVVLCEELKPGEAMMIRHGTLDEAREEAVSGRPVASWGP